MTELGPGFLRRPPKGWLPGHAFAVEHSATNWPDTATGPSMNQSVRLDAIWEVHLDGYGPYRFEDVRRTAPLWCSTSGSLKAKRWYKVRLKNSYGLMADIPIPVHANPGNREDIWIDWDAAWELHVQAWELKDRVELEKARRAGKVEYLAERITNPFAGRLKPGEEALVDEVLEAERIQQAEEAERVRPQLEAQMAAMGFAPVSSDEQAEHKRRQEEMERVYRDGRPAKATVVGNERTGRVLNNIPVFEITLEIHDGGPPRRLVYEHVWGPRHAKRYKPGKQVDIRVDRQNPDLITPA